jgi:protein-L-isoaspartate(D-aspartate) O-methyltransferase
MPHSAMLKATTSYLFMYRVVRMSSVMAVCLLLLTCSSRATKEDSYRSARQRMVTQDIQGRGIRDARVIEAMRKVERHLFVPEPYRPMAYADRPLPIGEGQTISQPYIVALMTYQLHLQPDDRVLEIGTGSGYQAAILGELAKEVYSIEVIEKLAHAAQERLRRLGYTNVRVRSGDGFYGWAEHAPYDAIIITCSAPIVPQRLIEQLKDGARLIVPLGNKPLDQKGTFGPQSLTLITRRGEKIEQQRLEDVIFVPMTGQIDKVKK